MTRLEAAAILTETLDDAAQYVAHTPVDYDERNRAALAVLSAPIAVAHPKCGTCLSKLYSAKHDADFCFSPASPMRGKIVERTIDYCRHHPELNQPTETTS